MMLCHCHSWSQIHHLIFNKSRTPRVGAGARPPAKTDPNGRPRIPLKFEKAELIEKFRLNRPL